MGGTARILAFAGSARDGSFNKKLIRIAANGARDAGATVTLLDLRDYEMPIYDGDLEDGSGHGSQVTSTLQLLSAGANVPVPTMWWGNCSSRTNPLLRPWGPALPPPWTASAAPCGSFRASTCSSFAKGTC